MTCPICGNETKVIDSRSQVDFIYRRRRCIACNHTFTTSETEDDIAKNIKAADKKSKNIILSDVYFNALSTISSLCCNYSGCRTPTSLKKLIDEIEKIANTAIEEKYKL